MVERDGLSRATEVDQLDMEKFVDTVYEVFDVNSGALLGSLRDPWGFGSLHFGFADGERVLERLPRGLSSLTLTLCALSRRGRAGSQSVEGEPPEASED